MYIALLSLFSMENFNGNLIQSTNQMHITVLPRFLSEYLSSSIALKHKSFLLTNTLKRIPYSLIPFVLSMFFNCPCSS